ncbi:MAG: helicase-related protein [Sandaracinaceae bacterium]|nr:helicase-related protein [Sandaracinaceae bacterium]
MHSQASSDPREESLAGLAAGTVSAVCSVDVFNEGVDVPAVDRVVMLRPTESPVVFLQQLGRGLRRHEGKDRLVVIDFVGNHKVFLDRVRRLLSLAGGERAPSLRELVDSAGPLELPHGCSVDVELEAKELLRLLVPRGRTEVERVYRELRESRGERPTAGELQRMGYSVRSLLTGGHGSWFSFVDGERDLDEIEQRVLATSGAWLREIETTAMTRSFKMVVLQALLEAEALTVGMKLDELARRCWSALRRSPELFADVPRDRFESGGVLDERAWAAYWRGNPIDAWSKAAEGSKKRLWFRVEDDRFVPLIPLAEGTGEALARMTRELVDYRLAQYRARHALPRRRGELRLQGHVEQAGPDPQAASRQERPDVPRGELDVRVRDGRVWRFRFAKEFCNRAHPVGDPRNRLPDLMRSGSGRTPGTPAPTSAFASRAARTAGGSSGSAR